MTERKSAKTGEPLGNVPSGQDSSAVPTTEEGPNDEQREDTDVSEPSEEPFTREYVERLRREAADYRTKAKRADELSSRLLNSSCARARLESSRTPRTCSAATRPPTSSTTAAIPTSRR